MASQSPFSSAFLQCYGQIHQEAPFLPWPLWPLQKDSPRARVVRSSASPSFILVSTIGAPAYWVSRKGRTSCGEASDSRATPGRGEKQHWGCPKQIWQLRGWKPQTRLPWTEPGGKSRSLRRNHEGQAAEPVLGHRGSQSPGQLFEPLGLWSTTPLKTREALLLPPAEPPPSSFHYHTHTPGKIHNGRFCMKRPNFRAPEIGHSYQAQTSGSPSPPSLLLTPLRPWKQWNNRQKSGSWGRGTL